MIMGPPNVVLKEKGVYRFPIEILHNRIKTENQPYRKLTAGANENIAALSQ
jgi:hypothetical protein